MTDSPIRVQAATVTLDDGKQLHLDITNPDMVRWDITAPKHKWPTLKEAPILWATFVTWAAAKRTGAYEGTFEAWRDTDALVVDMQREPGEDGEPGTPVDPTHAGAEPA